VVTAFTVAHSIRCSPRPTTWRRTRSGSRRSSRR
jgi:hypothetical protein